MQSYTPAYTLETSLQAIEPHLAPLISPEVMERLRAVSRCFPDALTFSYGFEYRLQPPAPTVDFAIHITEAERDILAGLDPHIRLAAPFEQQPVWQRIRQFCAGWSDPSDELHHRVADLWLEFDAQGDDSAATTTALPTPGLFFRPANPGLAPGHGWIRERALPLLLGTAIPPAVQDKLSDCLTHMPPHAGLFQVGLMPGRKVAAIRLCLVGSPPELVSYLAQVGWEGSLEDVETIVASLRQYVDGIILDIDVGERIYPRIGIEGIYLTRYLACVNGQWQALLDHLVARGLCSAPTRDALLAYVGYNLAQPLHRRIYVRGLNHVKLVYQPGQPLAAKVYFGAMHKPVSAIPARTAGLTDAESVGQARTQGPRAATVAQAVQPAVTFLLAARDSEGWWRDFHLAAGIGDEWVTGYVGTMLAAVPDGRIAGAVAAAWMLLQARRHRANGTWGYNRFPPGDADSTGWALQLARAIGENGSERARQASRALAAHTRPDGGMSTYAHEEPIRAFIHAPPTLGFAGWCGSHVCVSAALAALPDYRCRLRDYLHATQASDGSWPAYWWHDHEYATALAAEALAATDLDAACVARAVGWGMNRLSPQGFVATGDHPSGSPFATAWLLRLLLLGTADIAVRDAVARATGWLVRQQQADGSWVSSARLRVPYPDDLNPNTFDGWVYHGAIQGSLVFDQQRTFTTATVLHALYRSLGAQSDEP